MTKIEWVRSETGAQGKAWNPIAGCSIVSPGCTNCYAMKMASRLEAIAGDGLDDNGYATRGPNPLGHYRGLTRPSKAGAVWTGKVARAPEATMLAPLKRKKPITYFVNSMSDLFHEDVTDAWIDQVFAVMALSPQHTFQVLTKRSERMRDYLKHRWEDMSNGEPDTMWEDCTYWRVATAAKAIDNGRYDRSNIGGCEWWPLPNVWLGVSAERQKEADERIPDLLATPAAVRFVSAEPLLGPIDFKLGSGEWGVGSGRAPIPHSQFPTPSLDWIIVGGESGPGARPMHPDWARAIRDQCVSAEVAFFFKQWGAFGHGSRMAKDSIVVFNDGRTSAWTKEACDAENRAAGSFQERRPELMTRMRKQDSGRLLDGREWNEMPAARHPRAGGAPSKPEAEHVT